MVNVNDTSEPTGPAGRDALDAIVEEVRAQTPGVEVIGLPITGRVLRLARYLEAQREQQLGSFGLTVADFDMLATLRRRAARGPVNIRELQHSLMLSSGGTTKRLDRLELAGLIERLPDPNDRRGVLIGLSSAGRALIDEVVPAIMRFESTYIAEAVPSVRLREQLEEGLRRMLTTHETL